MLDILFINPSDRCDLRTEVNGTLILATKLLQAGFRVQVLRFGEIEGYNKDYEVFVEAAVEQIKKRNPRCVSFYTLWTDYHIMLHIAKEVKQRVGDITVVFGGPQASATAVDAMKVAPYIDYICAGEGVSEFHVLSGKTHTDACFIIGKECADPRIRNDLFAVIRIGMLRNDSL